MFNKNAILLSYLSLKLSSKNLWFIILLTVKYLSIFLISTNKMVLIKLLTYQNTCLHR